MEDEKTMNEEEPQEFWGEAKCGIWVSDLGNSKDQITQYRGRNVIRKTVTIKKKVKIKGVEKILTKEIQKRFQVARLVLECFPMQECPFQRDGWGNHEGKGIVLWENGNELDDRADNLSWQAHGPGWTKEQTEEACALTQRAIEELGMQEKTPAMKAYYLQLKNRKKAKK